MSGEQERAEAASERMAARAYSVGTWVKFRRTKPFLFQGYGGVFKVLPGEALGTIISINTDKAETIVIVDRETGEEFSAWAVEAFELAWEIDDDQG